MDKRGIKIITIIVKMLDMSMDASLIFLATTYQARAKRIKVNFINTIDLTHNTGQSFLRFYLFTKLYRKKQKVTLSLQRQLTVFQDGIASIQGCY